MLNRRFMSTATQSGGGKKQRECPVLGRTISSAECGSQRGSRLACPATCAFFPFAPPGYELWLKVEREWTDKAASRVLATWGRDRMQRAVRGHVIPLGQREPDLQTAVTHALRHLLFRETTPRGTTVAGEWEAADWAGLNNDERLMMQCQRQARASVIEVQRVIDARTVTATDLLEPDRPPMTVLSPGLATQTTRFSRLLTVLIPGPHFVRTGMLMMPLPHELWEPWIAQLRNASAGAPGSPVGLVAYLEAHLGEYVELIHRLAGEYHAGLVDRLGLHQCVAAFRLTGTAEGLAGALAARSDFRQADPPIDSRFAACQSCFEWLAGAAPEAGSRGWVRVYPDEVLIETRSRADHTLARELAARDFAGLVEYKGESVLDLTEAANQHKRREGLVALAGDAVYGGSPQPASGPGTPGSEETAEAEDVAAAHEARYRAFLDAPVPELDGRTPRQAATEPDLRPRLVTIMKAHVCNLERRNRREGLNLSLDPVLDMLGLPELK